MKKKLLALTLALAVILLCFTACGGNKPTDGNLTDSNVTDSNVTDSNVTDSNAADVSTEDADPFFSAFTTTTIYGKEVTEEIFCGSKLTMVNVWGTFCSPCIGEMPDLEKLSQDYADKGVKIIGIVSDVYDYIKRENNPSKIEDAKSIIEETGVTYTNLLPSDSLNEAKLNYINVLPTTYFLNEKGEIVMQEYVGSRSYDQWANIINNLLIVVNG